MPNLEKYKKLIADLSAAKKDFDAAKEDDKKRLASAVQALEGALLYFTADSEVREGGLVQPLTFILNAIWDAKQGSNPAALSHRPEGAAPVDTSHEYVQAGLAWLLEMMSQAKVGTESSARRLATMLRKAGLEDANGSEIGWKRIDQWRKDCRAGRAPEMVLKGWAAWRQHDAQLLKLPIAERRKAVEKELPVRIDVFRDAFPRATRPERQRTENPDKLASLPPEGPPT